MQNLLENLKSLLSDDERLMIDGELMKNKVIELALQLDKGLIKALLSRKSTKKHFFQEVDGVLVFDKIKFQRFVSNKAFLPDSYTAFKNKIGLVSDGGNYITESKEVALAWPYKDCVLEGGQTKEEQKRDEVFWNETLAPDDIDRLLEPKVFTNFKRIDKKGKHKADHFNIDEKGTIRDNLIIKGNNLLALASARKRFTGKVKLIYVDPPYNTGDDEFGYNDSFNHSTWLTFMKDRMTVARDFLTEDGSLWINIGDEEVHYLKVLLDEIFIQGFVAHVLWQKRTSPDARKPLGDAHDHILVYSKNPKQFRSKCKPIPLTDEQRSQFKNPDGDPKGPWVSTDFTATGYRPNQMYDITTPSGKKYKPPERKCWTKIESEYLKLKEEGRMWFGVNGDAMPRRKTYLFESKGITAWTWWENKDVGHNQEAKHESVALFGNSQPFSTPKPERLLKRIIEICTEENDLVMDFFAGSGTTAAVAMKMNRRFISIEQMLYAIDYNTERLIKVIGGEKGGISEAVNWQGGGSFIYCELAKANQEYIDRIAKAKNTKELKAIWETMQRKAFISYKVDIKATNQNADSFDELSLEEQKRFLIEILDKNLLYVNLSEIDDKDYKISKEDKALNAKFYSLK